MNTCLGGGNTEVCDMLAVCHLFRQAKQTDRQTDGSKGRNQKDLAAKSLASTHTDTSQDGGRWSRGVEVQVP
jgi:hypothetical protein